jgi:hypothetical protein
MSRIPGFPRLFRLEKSELLVRLAISDVPRGRVGRTDIYPRRTWRATFGRTYGA